MKKLTRLFLGCTISLLSIGLILHLVGMAVNGPSAINLAVLPAIWALYNAVTDILA